MRRTKQFGNLRQLVMNSDTDVGDSFERIEISDSDSDSDCSVAPIKGLKFVEIYDEDGNEWVTIENVGRKAICNSDENQVGIWLLMKVQVKIMMSVVNTRGNYTC